MILKSNNRLVVLIISGIIYSSMWSCSVKPIWLFENSSTVDSVPHIENVYALQIFKDYLSSEIWFTEDTSCLKVENVFDEKAIDNGALFLKWNKTSGGCIWVGMGIGWDGWNPKNLQEIYPNASIEFLVRSPKGTQNGLPWAMALEDYSGGQAWAGVFANYIDGQKITENWTRVQVPLSAFDLTEFDADITSIKHLIIQFESEGEIFLDELRIIPGQSVQSKTIDIEIKNSAPVVDGIFDSTNYNKTPFELENGKVWFSLQQNTITLFASVVDKTPLQNNQNGKDIWNGDAIEIAFSTNANASLTRKSFLLSDQHLGIRANSNPEIWNWRMQQSAQGTVVTKKTNSGYLLEASIPLQQFIASNFIAGSTYGIEVAIDAGNQINGREIQYRWNNPYNEGFHNSPQLWGKMQITNESAIK